MKAVILLALVAVAAAAPYMYTLEGSILENIRIINAVNSDPESTWVAGMNSWFYNRTLDQTRRLCGAREGGPLLPRRTYGVVTGIPEEFDARKAWPNCPSMDEIRDQSNCGSCWAFGAASAATDRVCIASNGTRTPHLSANDILACCADCGFGCEGGYPASAWNWIQRTGVVTGGNYNDFSGCYSYPFENCEHHTTGKFPACSTLPSYSTPKCARKCDDKSNYPVAYQDDKLRFNSSYSIRGEADIQKEIMTYGPIEGAFSVYADFVNYKSGVYQHKEGSYLGGHAIKIMGWGVENGVKYWWIANSWNEDWGMGGYFKMLRGSNHCGIEDRGTAGQVYFK